MQSPQEISVDVVIIGGGPSGLSTALHLTRLEPSWAARLVILEKERHPRHKLCGGGITGFGLSQLQSLGLPIDFPYIPVEKAELKYKDRVVTIHGKPTFVVTQRSTFDAWLAEMARSLGIQLVEDTPVIGIQRDGDLLQVRTPDKIFFTKAIVGADGARGFVRRWLGARERPARVARALEALVPSKGDEIEFTRRLARFDFSARRSHLQGYFWRFPSLVEREPYMNAGIYDARVDGRAPKAHLAGLLHEGLQEMGGYKQAHMPEGHPIRWFSPWNRVSDRNVLLVGDAAGVDPLFGEGISVSLAYGKTAARYLHRAFVEGKLDFSDYKRKILLSQVGRYLLLRWLVVSVLTPLTKSDLLTRGVWSLVGLFGMFINPSTDLSTTRHLKAPFPFE